MPPAQPAGWTEDTTNAVEALSNTADEGQPGGYASSCDEEDRQESKAMQELQEEICRLHDQVLTCVSMPLQVRRFKCIWWKGHKHPKGKTQFFQ